MIAAWHWRRSTPEAIPLHLRFYWSLQKQFVSTGPSHSLHQPQAQEPSSSPQCQFKVVWFPASHLSSKAEFVALRREYFFFLLVLKQWLIVFSEPGSELWALSDQHGLHPSSVGPDPRCKIRSSTVSPDRSTSPKAIDGNPNAQYSSRPAQSFLHSGDCFHE